MKIYFYLMKETELVDKYIVFRKKTEPKAFIIKERGYRQKKIDLIEVDFKPKLILHGIEFKIYNWKLS